MSKFITVLCLAVFSLTIQALQFTIYKGNDQSFDKPVIVVEGYDPHNEYSAATLHGSLPTDLKDEIAQDGRDLVIVDFIDGGASIQDNSNELISLIKEINRLKGNSTHPNAVIGISMGGLLARYALKTMENNGESHDTSLYISYDAPHRGANIPKDIKNNIDSYIDYLDSILFGYTPSSLSRARTYYDSPAAQQILIWGDEATTFYRTLENLGYPDDLVRIAYSSGSSDGLSYGRTVGDIALDYRVEILGLKTFKHKITMRNNKGCNFPCDRLKSTFYDNAPGGSADNIVLFRTNMINANSTIFDYDENDYRFPAHSFVPTLSALDVRNYDIYTPFVQLSNYHSPFDQVFTNTHNERHTFIGLNFEASIIDNLVNYHTRNVSTPLRTNNVIPLKDVTGLKNEWLQAGSNLLTWNAVEGATYYEVFISEDGEIFYDPIKTVTNTVTGVTVSQDNTIVAVRACNNNICSYSDIVTAKFKTGTIRPF